MSRSKLVTLSRAKILRKLVTGPFLRANESIWNRLPRSIRELRAVTSYGVFLHSLVQLGANRTQFHGTFFLRNRAELEAIRSVAERKAEGAPLKIVVLACSNGAEVYSILWFVRSARPDLRLEVFAVDISEEIVRIARGGAYSVGINSLVNEHILARMTEQEIGAVFDREGDELRVKRWIGEGVHWIVGDAGDSNLARRLGPADIVVANKFLCHMAPPDAERCLRNLPNFVRPDGFLFVSGVDLDVRLKVATDLGWVPVLERLEEIHNGDPSVRRDWPWRYWGLEPLDSKRPDWKTRYAAVFRIATPKQPRELADSVR